MNGLALIALGLAVGVMSGLVGIGGGIFLVPALVFLFGFEQHTAQGTTAALLVPPIGIFAAYTYYQKGYVDIRAALWICAGFVFGSYFGAKIAVGVPKEVLRKGFGFLLLAVSARMIIGK